MISYEYYKEDTTEAELERVNNNLEWLSKRHKSLIEYKECLPVFIRENKHKLILITSQGLEHALSIYIKHHKLVLEDCDKLWRELETKEDYERLKIALEQLEQAKYFGEIIPELEAIQEQANQIKGA